MLLSIFIADVEFIDFFLSYSYAMKWLLYSQLRLILKFLLVVMFVFYVSKRELGMSIAEFRMISYRVKETVGFYRF